MPESQQRDLAKLVATLLGNAAPLRWFSAVLMLAPLLLLWGGKLQGWPELLSALLMVLFGLAGQYLGLRVALDAKLFAALAGEHSCERLDHSMQQLGWLKEEQAGRSMLQRAQGAQALLKRLFLCFAGQAAALVLLLVWRFFL
ncbi:hypothetical protein [Shewanella algae]|uniref:hypothetical protein n=1 Tax=Shewanella algae TaxID=38313 RepID=UPI000BB621F0|nr:hypothetical protein [Shewanella algae]PBQ29734.1 hypothetical protein AYI97_02545 [Shewanella algae]QNI00376.1 hypothetical protein HU689_18425 [Shewanella algae]